MALCERPGGLALTEYFIQNYSLPKRACILDVGCGQGTTVRLLREKYGHEAYGIDLIQCGRDSFLLQGDGANLPWEDESFDAVLMECSLSRTEKPELVLHEVRRVLRPGGLLYVSDLYTRGQSVCLAGQVMRVDPLDMQQKLIHSVGLSLLSTTIEDKHLVEYYATLIFESGRDASCQALGLLPETDVRQWGYYTSVYVAPTEREILLLPNELRCWQLKQASNAIIRARKLSQYYQKSLKGYSIERILSEHSLRSLPFLTAEQVRQEGMQLLAVPLSETARIRTVRSSGTSGPAKRIYFSKEDLSRTERFFAAGMRLIVGARYCSILFSDNSPCSAAALLQRSLARIGVTANIYGRPRSISDIKSLETDCGCLVGHPADLYYIACHRPQLRPSSVLLSADYIPPVLISRLEMIWGCPVYTHYGMTETCYGLAVQCPFSVGQRLRWQDFYVEIIDPVTAQELPIGAEGEVVLTSLYPDSAMPLIRYRTGDIASLLPSAPSRNQWEPCLSHVKGRIKNLTDTWGIHQLDDLIFSFPGVISYYPEACEQGLNLQIEGFLTDTERLFLQNHIPSLHQITFKETPPWITGEKRNIRLCK